MLKTFIEECGFVASWHDWSRGIPDLIALAWSCRGGAGDDPEIALNRSASFPAEQPIRLLGSSGNRNENLLRESLLNDVEKRPRLGTDETAEF